MAKFKVSPIGEFLYPWVNKPDTKFNEEGVYSVDLALSGRAAEELKAMIDGAAEEAFEAETDKMTPAQKKAYSKYVPYEDEEDDEGTATGRTIFHFKQNAKIKTKDGDIKEIKIEVRDSKDKPVNVAVYGGSEGRIMFTTRNIKMTSTKQAGVRLDFSKVQITKLQKASGGGFGAVDGGFTADEDVRDNEPEDDGAGDY